MLTLGDLSGTTEARRDNDHESAAETIRRRNTNKQTERQFAPSVADLSIHGERRSR